MKYYFIDDENGTIFSEDKTRSFRMLTGREAMAFFQTPRGKGTRFMEQNLDGSEDTYFMEVPKDQEDDFRRDERREQYNRDTRAETGYTHISFESVTGDSGDETGEEMLIDESVDIEKEIFERNDILILRSALMQLSKDEWALINAMFLEEKTFTSRELEERFGVSHTVILRRKRRILEKLKNYFE